MSSDNKIRYGALGSAGSWSHAAGAKAYPDGERVGFPSFQEIADGLKKGLCDVAVFPVRNSLTGPIPGVAQIIEAAGLKQIEEAPLPIHHCLVGHPDFHQADKIPIGIDRIYSHPQGFLQCKTLLGEHFPNAEHVETTDTASGVKKVEELATGNVLGIGSNFAATLYNGVVIKPAINDDPSNTTWFAFCQL